MRNNRFGYDPDAWDAFWCFVVILEVLAILWVFPSTV